MTVRETLEKFEDSQKVKIGASGGSGWFVIGTVEEIKANLADIETAIMVYPNQRLERAEKAFSKACHNPMDMSAYMLKQLARHQQGFVPDLTWEGYLKEFEKYCHTVETKLATIRRMEDAKYNVKQLMDREVLDVSKSIKKDGMRILVEGNEEGLWWDAEEKKEGDKIYGFRAEENNEHI